MQNRLQSSLFLYVTRVSVTKYDFDDLYISEMARRIAEAKMRRKMERQAQLQVQREARRQQGEL